MNSGVNSQSIQQESWSSYLWRAAKYTTYGSLVGFSISLNPVGTAVTAATALVAFLTTEWIKLDHPLIIANKHLMYATYPAVLARYIPGTPNCPLRIISNSAHSCVGVDYMKGLLSYSAFKAVDKYGKCNEAAKYAFATGASILVLSYLKVTEELYVQDIIIEYLVNQKPVTRLPTQKFITFHNGSGQVM